ncbi:hypothetical protein AB0395_45875 [Streptosporangium sp. NPDC051023]
MDNFQRILTTEPHLPEGGKTAPGCLFGRCETSPRPSGVFEISNATSMP